MEISEFSGKNRTIYIVVNTGNNEKIGQCKLISCRNILIINSDISHLGFKGGEVKRANTFSRAKQSFDSLG